MVPILVVPFPDPKTAIDRRQFLLLLAIIVSARMEEVLLANSHSQLQWELFVAPLFRFDVAVDWVFPPHDWFQLQMRQHRQLVQQQQLMLHD